MQVVMCEPASKLENKPTSHIQLQKLPTTAIYKSHTQLKNSSNTTEYLSETKELG